MRVFGIVVKYCNSENSYPVFILVLGFKNCSLLALMWIPEDKGFLFPFSSLLKSMHFLKICVDV